MSVGEIQESSDEYASAFTTFHSTEELDEEWIVNILFHFEKQTIYGFRTTWEHVMSGAESGQKQALALPQQGSDGMQDKAATATPRDISTQAKLCG